MLEESFFNDLYQADNFELYDSLVTVDGIIFNFVSEIVVKRCNMSYASALRLIYVLVSLNNLNSKDKDEFVQLRVPFKDNHQSDCSRCDIMDK